MVASLLSITLQLSDIGLPLADPILNLNYAPTGTFFSNLPDSNQSSVGMTLTESETYWSTNWNCNALRMNGVDGVLNNTILSRAIVIHGFDFSASDVAWDAQTPTSWGCVMLPKSGFFEGTPSAPIADLIIRDIIGGPVLLYHDRLDPKINEQDYQAELQFYEKLKSMIADQIAELSTKYGWSPEQASGYLEQLHVKLREKLMPRVDATYAYFKTPSLYVGVELKSEDACEKVLGLN